MRRSKEQETKPTIRFSVLLSRHEVTEKTAPWIAHAFPKSAKLPARGTTTVEGMINGCPFRAAVKADGKGSLSLRISDAMREASGADAGDTVTVEITRVADEPEIRVPMDLRKALAAAPDSRAGWRDITPMARRDWIFSICSAKQPETRKRRIDKACDMLACGKRRLCCFPGVKWLMEKNAKSCGMWAPLPDSRIRPSSRSITPD
jgi:Bacteriocin-protection, YdeI or OmpD-Associated/Domain of unknown function (DUF1905)